MTNPELVAVAILAQSPVKPLSARQAEALLNQSVNDPARRDDVVAALMTLSTSGRRLGEDQAA